MSVKIISSYTPLLYSKIGVYRGVQFFLFLFTEAVLSIF